MNKNKFLKTIVTFVMLIAVTSMFAQITPTDPDGDPDPEDGDLNPAPISDYLLPMLVVGVATAYVLLRKKSVQNAA